jgi:3-oxoacyl-[acyl-carrier protein] reductase
VCKVSFDDTSGTKDNYEALAKFIPLGKIGKVEDISSVVEFLIKNDYMTGQSVSPNGGIIMP